MLWREPKAPDFVLEITLRSTRSEDQGAKRGIYAFLGVQEYWQYDPTGDYLVPPLQGLRLEEEIISPYQLPRCRMARCHSIGQSLLTHQEAEQARRTAEARIAELEARLQALQSASPLPLTPPDETQA